MDLIPLQLRPTTRSSNEFYTTATTTKKTGRIYWQQIFSSAWIWYEQSRKSSVACIVPSIHGLAQHQSDRDENGHHPQKSIQNSLWRPWHTYNTNIGFNSKPDRNRFYDWMASPTSSAAACWKCKPVSNTRNSARISIGFPFVIIPVSLSLLNTPPLSIFKWCYTSCHKRRTEGKVKKKKKEREKKKKKKANK